MNPTERAALLRKLREREAEKVSDIEFLRWCTEGQPSVLGAKAEAEIEAHYKGSALLEEKLLEAVERIRCDCKDLPYYGCSGPCSGCQWKQKFDSWLEGKK